VRQLILFVIASLLAAPGFGSEPTEAPRRVRSIDILHFSHTDIGYTDQPSIARELHGRFLDIAIDACLSTQARPPASRFHWTAESMLPVDDWWRTASPTRRKDLLRVIRSGQLDVGALPFNVAPLLDAREWDTAVRWAAEDVRRAVAPSVAIQNDVNGFPRAAAMRLLDLGVRHAFVGINPYHGGPPFERPAAFWWRMPDGRRLFVYLAEHYGMGLGYFHEGEWRTAWSPRAGNGLHRPPRPGELLSADAAAVRKAHARCVEQLRKIEAGGYRYSRLITSITNAWRWDNDPPMPALADFVATWNRLALEPPLRLMTVSAAVRELESEVGAQIPTYEGEWTDWWADGAASTPRALAASRMAKRAVSTALSPAFGPFPPSGRQALDEILRELVLFEEHTWGSSDSLPLPDALDTHAQLAEKTLYAYRAMARAELLLGRRQQAALGHQPEGVHVTNTASLPISGWARFPVRSARRAFASLREAATGRVVAVSIAKAIDKLAPSQAPAPIGAIGDGDVASVWVELPASGTVHLQYDDTKAEPAAVTGQPEVTLDDMGWPVAVRWPEMAEPLFLEGSGAFLSVQAGAGRDVVGRLASGQGSGEEREQKRREILREMAATPEGARAVDSGHSLVYTQALWHPRLRKAERRLEVWKGHPRARLHLRFERFPSTEPEILYADFRLPAEDLPTLSNGGVSFVPFREQLGQSCRDYFSTDGWALFRGANGAWLWASRDAPLVTVGGPNALARVQAAPSKPGRILAMLFNNTWDTNFAAEETGTLQFQFDIAWRQQIDDPAALAEALVTDPLVLLVPSAAPDPLVQKHLLRP
jgi:alpha-mannosidase